MLREVITCGVRWGSGAPSFAQLSLDHNRVILGVTNAGIERFRNVQEGDLIALKDGFNIIALGKFKKAEHIITWETLLKQIYPEEKDLEKFSEQYWFELESKIDIIEVEEWIALDPPVYYPMRMSTVQIRDNDIKQICNDRFQEWVDGVKANEEEKRQEKIKFLQKSTEGLLYDTTAPTSKDRLQDLIQARANINQLKVLDVGNKEIELLDKLEKEIRATVTAKFEIEEKDQKEKVGIIDRQFKELFTKKSETLKSVNYLYIYIFLGILSILTGGLIYILLLPPNKMLQYYFMPIHLFVFSKVTISSTIILTIFWVARFFNRRIHENVLLIEEYTHKVTLLMSYEYLTRLFPNSNHKILNESIISALTHNPTTLLHKRKGDNIPFEDAIALTKVAGSNKVDLDNIPKTS